MGTDKSRTFYSALGVPDPRMTFANLWAAQSSYTQAGPAPGDPEPQTNDGGVYPRMTLTSSGTQAASGALRIKALRGGYPGSGPKAAAFVWRNDGDANWRGWNPPITIQNFESLVWTDGTGVTTGTAYPHAVTLADGTIVLAYQATTTTGATQHRVVTRTRATDGTWSSASFTYSAGTTTTHGLWPCLVKMPARYPGQTERVLLFHYVEGTNEYQIRVHASDDGGSTWYVASKYALEAALDTSSDTPKRIRAAYHNGQLCLVIWKTKTTGTYKDVLVQYASTTEGAVLELVDEWDGSTEAGGYHDLVVLGDEFILPHIDATTNEAAIRRAGSAFDAFTDDTQEDIIGVGTGQASTEVWGQQTTAAFTQGDLAAVVDPDGTFYLFGRQPSVTGRPAIAIRSTDNGVTWEGVGQDSFGTGGTSAWFNVNDNSTYPTGFCGVAQGGRVVLFTNHAADPGNEDNSLHALYLGSYSTVTLPGYSSFPNDTTRVSWTLTGLPFDLPGDAGWTAAGTGTQTLTSGALNISTTGAVRTYTKNPTGTIAEGIIMRLKLQVVSGGALTSDAVAVRVRLADATDDYDVSIRFSTSGLRVYDNNAAAQVGSDLTTIDPSSGVEVMFGMADGTFALWARDTDTLEQEWTAGPTSSGLTSDTATPAANNEVVFGHVFSSTAESNWQEWHYVSDEWAGTGLSTTPTNPDDLFPRTFSQAPVWVDGGVYVSALGFAWENDTWHLDTRYRYALSQALPDVQPSPSQAWRSTADGVQTTIAWAIDDSTGVASLLANASGFLYLDGCNWRDGEIQTHNGSTWSTLQTIDMAEGLTSLPYIRKGNVLTVNTGSANTADHWVHLDELVGATVDLGGGKLRKVTGLQTPGVWTDGTAPRPRLILDGVDGTEGTSGTCNIWSPRAVCIFHLAGTADQVQGIRLVIDAQTTQEGDYRASVILPGWLLPFGHAHDWGRVDRLRVNYSMAESRSGRRRVRKEGPARRIVELAWSEGIDQTDWQGQNPDPNYILGTSTGSAAPIGGATDIPATLSYLLEHLGGASTPVVWLPYVPKGTPDNVTLALREQSLYGRIVSDEIRRDQVLGDELQTDVVRVGPIVIEEEV